MKTFNEREKVNRMVVADMFANFKLSGAALHHARPANEWEHREAEERRRYALLFPGNENARRRHVDKESVILKYQQIYLRGRFPFGIPDNFLTGPKVVALLKNSHGA